VDAAGWLMSRALGLVVVTLGLLQLVSVATAGDPLAPLSHLRGQSAAAHGTDFVRIRSSAELDAALKQNAAGERVRSCWISMPTGACPARKWNASPLPIRG
jgi:thiol:disulfide interchange protein DsbD